MLLVGIAYLQLIRIISTYVLLELMLDRQASVKRPPTSMYFFDTFTNYVGTQNEFKTKLKIDFELRFHDLEWSWALIFINRYVIFQ